MLCAPWCLGVTRVFKRGVRSIKMRASSAKAYLLKEPPDLSMPIAKVHEVIRQYNVREGVLTGRAEQSSRQAHACVNEFKRTKNPVAKQGAIQHLRSKNIQERHAMQLRQRRGVLETHLHTLEEAGMQGNTVRALRTSSAALKSYGRSVNLDQVDALLNHLEDAADINTDFSDTFDNRDESWGSADIEEELEAMMSSDAEPFETDEPWIASGDQAARAPDASQAVVLQHKGSSIDNGSNNERASLMAHME